MSRDDTLIRAFAPARSLEPTEAEIARILRRASASSRLFRFRARPVWFTTSAFGVSRHRLALVALAVVVLLPATGYAAAAPIRAAINDVAGTFAGWLGGNSSEAPGRPLGSHEEAPNYFRDRRYALEPRVIAQADGYKLYAAREPAGTVEFDLGDTGVGLGGFSADVFRDHVLVILGPGAMQNADEHGHVPLFGIAARSVTSVELTYDSGPPLRVEGVHGGFVLLAEPRRSPRQVVAFDRAGHELARASVDDSSHDGPRIDWRRYGPPSPRVPSACQPGAVGLKPPKRCPGT